MNRKEIPQGEQRFVMLGGGGSTLDFVTPAEKARLDAKSARKAARREKIGTSLQKAKVLFRRG